MVEVYAMHKDGPAPRLIEKARDILLSEGVIVYPTDTGYALGCIAGSKFAENRIRKIRRLNDKHLFTLVCEDLSKLSLYAKVHNCAYRFMKKYTPGAFTFILPATKELPRRLMHPRRKTIGLRVPQHKVALALLHAVDEPMISTTLSIPGYSQPFTDPSLIKEKLGHLLDLIIDSGPTFHEETTVMNLMIDPPEIIRLGKGML